jgi:hypothetical protein
MLKKVAMNVFKLTRHLRGKKDLMLFKTFRAMKNFSKSSKIRSLKKTVEVKLDPSDPTEVDLQLETGRTKNSERFDRNDNVFVQSK